ncbi:hypothetical protein ASPCAL02397 [Aspergillus calidoustus]|uniref:Uncharacterized protein n=1 Tax=Aspergillus calidoustus TaxID=454130 RepID=A0A0U5CMJ2_ASPCI|nr:hypothetical protein ASPCAL02397 [Aspergillus calidoustus]
MKCCHRKFWNPDPRQTGNWPGRIENIDDFQDACACWTCVIIPSAPILLWQWIVRPCRRPRPADARAEEMQRERERLAALAEARAKHERDAALINQQPTLVSGLPERPWMKVEVKGYPHEEERTRKSEREAMG